MKILTGLVLIIVLIVALVVSGPDAGAPPTDAIPWDSVMCVDTIHVRGAEPLLDPHWVHFITRDKYEYAVLGYDFRQDVRDLKRDLELVKKAIQRKNEP